MPLRYAAARAVLGPAPASARLARLPLRPFGSHPRIRSFQTVRPLQAVRPYLLADIGEGITECQIIQWFVQPGAKVAQFDKICEVQSDKASVEITSRYDGVITKLHYETDDMAKVGKPLIDIDVQEDTDAPETGAAPAEPPSREAVPPAPSESPAPAAPSKYPTLATPAVRHLVKTLNVSLADLHGTGKAGRIMKEDVLRFVAARDAPETAHPSAPETAPLAPVIAQAQDTIVPLTPIQRQMFKTMTRSLSIPHFLYTDNVDFSTLTHIRRQLAGAGTKVTPLSFILKSISSALLRYPSLNAHLDTSNGDKPVLVSKASHNIGIAVDTPAGLMVPVIRDVQGLSILEIAAHVNRLTNLAKQGKLTTADLAGGTITVSNIGSIGGTAVAPVIVSPQVAILGVGRARAIPAFDEDGNVVKKMEAVFSWSADHRVVDGAMMARFAEEVRGGLERLEGMLVSLR